MKLRSYFRGIGAGMIVAALIMGIATSQPKAEPVPEDKQTLLESVTSISASTDTSVSASTETSASVLEETSISSDTTTSTDITASTESSVSKEEEQTETGTDAESKNSEDTSAKQEDSSVNQESDEETEDAEETDSSTDDNGGTEETVTLKIVKGDNSVKAARKAYEAGLVESAPSFNKYLCNNGYDKSIKVGTFKIPVGADYETIAKIISKKK